jgi:serine/threonine-protein kinase
MSSLVKNHVIANNFRITDKIGRGGMGTVYRGVQLSLDREVAIKVLADDATQDTTMVKRFEQEARAIARLNHARIVQVFEILTNVNGRHFMVMELLEGRTVEEYRLALGGTLPASEACRIGIQVAEALECAHAAGIVHRDIKPENVMVLRTGDVKVMDFGIARLLRDAEVKTQAGRALGTPLYMSPEQIMAKEIDGRADLYSLGAMLYALVAGAPPFQNTNPIMVARMQLTEAAEPVGRRAPKLSTEFAAIIDKAMCKKPEERFQSATEMKRALEAEMGQLQVRGEVQRAATIVDAPAFRGGAESATVVDAPSGEIMARANSGTGEMAVPPALAMAAGAGAGASEAAPQKPSTAEFDVPASQLDDLFAPDATPAMSQSAPAVSFDSAEQPAPSEGPALPRGETSFSIPMISRHAREEAARREREKAEKSISATPLASWPRSAAAVSPSFSIGHSSADSPRRRRSSPPSSRPAISRLTSIWTRKPAALAGSTSSPPFSCCSQSCPSSSRVPTATASGMRRAICSSCKIARRGRRSRSGFIATSSVSWARSRPLCSG